MSNDAIVNEYLARLAAAAVDLPAERRTELLEEVREHIGLAVAAANDPDDSSLHDILDRLGSPEEIVDAELESTALAGEAAGAVATTPTPWRPHVSTETKALLLLSLGAVFLPFVGPLAGLWVAWSSDRWTRVQKRTATVCVIGLLFLPAIIVIPILLSGEVTALINNFGPVIALIPLAGLLPALYLAIVLNVDIVVVERPKT